MNIFDQMFGDCKKGIHQFEKFLVESIPPKISSSMKTTVEGMQIYIESMTTKRYEIRCKHCGKKAE